MYPFNFFWLFWCLREGSRLRPRSQKSSGHPFPTSINRKIIFRIHYLCIHLIFFFEVLFWCFREGSRLRQRSQKSTETRREIKLSRAAKWTKKRGAGVFTGCKFKRVLVLFTHNPVRSMCICGTYAWKRFEGVIMILLYNPFTCVHHVCSIQGWR